MSQLEDYRRLLSGLADAQNRAATLHLSAVASLLGAAIEMSCDALEALQDEEAPRKSPRQRSESGLRARPNPQAEVRALPF